ncbi:hypothetical protein GCM10011583_08790 [Streptomyces camponoticapitis]|uniref:Uncharacterized protein n=1 Tax=Streptomyces camponoticapitis TaxID=1616125 RepID=A0ABQ2DYL9_9ACTN|nr:hypothetical protein GCM10011583_08790 [Streptomyces camponoticapitis]
MTAHGSVERAYRTPAESSRRHWMNDGKRRRTAIGTAAGGVGAAPAAAPLIGGPPQDGGDR